MANLGRKIMLLDSRGQGLSIGMLKLLVGTVIGFIGSLPNPPVLGFHQGDKITMAQVNFLTFLIKDAWKTDVRIVQNLIGFRPRLKNLLSLS